MKNLLKYIESKISLSLEEKDLISNYFQIEEVEAKTNLLDAGNTERFIYFLSSGIVKGYQNIDGKIIIIHLVDKHNFFSSFESFTNETPSDDYFTTITKCTLLKISKNDLDILKNHSPKWNVLIETITNEHLNCKIERVKDFQTLTAKERYQKFVKDTPNLALNVSIENIASFLGIEPQSLSRIRKQITF